MPGRAHVAVAIGAGEKEVEAALALVALHDRAGPHAWARGGADGGGRGNRDQLAGFASEREAAPARSARGAEQAGVASRRRGHEGNDRDRGGREQYPCAHSPNSFPYSAARGIRTASMARRFDRGNAAQGGGVTASNSPVSGSI